MIYRGELDKGDQSAVGAGERRNSGETVVIYAASRMSQLRKSSSAASQNRATERPPATVRQIANRAEGS